MIIDLTLTYNYQQTYTKMDTFIKPVKQIEFSLLNPEEFRRKSVCEITLLDLYSKNNEPNFG